MRTDDIRRMAHDIIDRCAVENDQIEYKKSASDAVKDGILKTACAFANTYMNREIGLLFIGIQEEDDEATGRKAVPVRPISGIPEAKIETTENELKSLLGHIRPKPAYHLLQDTIDGRFYIILAVEPGNNGPYETDQKAEKDPKIRLKAPASPLTSGLSTRTSRSTATERSSSSTPLTAMSPGASPSARSETTSPTAAGT